MKELNIRVVPARLNNFIITTLIPLGGALMPLFMGYAMGANPHPFNTLCGALALFTSWWMFRSIAAEWRDARMANRALHIVIKQQQEEIDRWNAELAAAQEYVDNYPEKGPDGQEEKEEAQ